MYMQTVPTVFGEPIPAAVQQRDAETYVIENGYGLDNKVPEYTPTPIQKIEKQSTQKPSQALEESKNESPGLEIKNQEDVLDLRTTICRSLRQ